MKIAHKEITQFYKTHTLKSTKNGVENDKINQITTPVIFKV